MLKRVFKKKIVLGLSCVLASTPVWAQGTPKKLSNAIKSSAIASKVLKGKPAAISAEQLKLLEKAFLSLEELRRAVVANPSWALSSDFSYISEDSENLGLILPQRPAQSASVAQQNRYLRSLASILYRENRALGRIVNKRPRSLQAGYAPLKEKYPYSPKQIQQLLAQQHPAFFKGDSPELTLVLPNGQKIQIRPFLFSTRPDSKTYIPAKNLAFVYDHLVRNQAQFLKTINEAKEFSFSNKQLLNKLINNASLFLGFDFVWKYMLAFQEIPVVDAPFNEEILAFNDSELNALAKQRNLILKLKIKGVWSDEDLYAFAQWSVYVDPVRTEAVMQAITLSKMNAALALLKAPVNSSVFKGIVAQLTQIQTAQEEMPPSGNKSQTKVFIRRLQKAHVRALKEYAKVIGKRSERIWAQEQTIYINPYQMWDGFGLNAPDPSPEKSAKNIQEMARHTRVEKALKQIKEISSKIEEELGQID